MKGFIKKILLSLMFTVTLAVSAHADELEDMVNYVRTGNVTGMTKYFDKIIGITINNNQATYSGAQAEIVLKDFFVKNTVKEFLVVQSGTSGTDSKYAIGDLVTASGTYQIYVVMKIKDDVYLLREIRFEKK